ncbi:sensor histidine kinase [Clostridium estertheticum]|uniref:sensor histidine kinase n=1 Tax=Clostridium estertheticum TaxID=238834 RepID=UPI001C0D2B93|nr:sensor histidine kinase [Clostridium estertheticum]MBU3199938.1 sensor histidine kinase [Clostridium estertheticum]WAG66964.1 sensor histidine kinase [Clostridium estertheticum]
MMIENIIRKLIKQYKNFLSNFKIQNRLFMSSILLISIIVISLFFLSHFIVSKFIIQKQSDYDLASMKQSNNLFRTFFLSTDGSVDILYKSPTIKKILTEDYDINNSLNTVDYLNTIESSVNASLINKDSLDNVIFIGRNNFTCVYTQMGSTFDSKTLENRLNFEKFSNHSLLSQYLNNPNNFAFYYVSKPNSEPQNDSEVEIKKLIDNKIIIIKKLVNVSGAIDGIVIITFNDNIIKSIISPSPYDRALYLIDNQGEVIWSDNINKKFNNKFVNSSIISEPTNTNVKKVSGEDYLITSSLMEPSNFTLISSTPVKTFFTYDKHTTLYAIIFGLICFLISFISSFYFSRSTCKQLKLMAYQLSNNKLAVPEKIAIPCVDSFFGKLSLLAKIYIHFTISVILPTVFFISSITYLNYNSYKNKIIELTDNSTKQLKWNIDSKIMNYDNLSIQTIFNEDIQKAFDINNYNSSNYQMKLKINDVFLNSKVKNKELLSMGLYDTNGKNIYSYIPFDTLPVITNSPNFFNIMKNNDNQLTYLGSSKNYLQLGPAMLFTRNVNSKSVNFGKLLGYLLFSIDQETFSNLSREVNLGDTGIFCLVDKNTNIISNNTIKAPFLKALEYTPAFKSPILKNNGFSKFNFQNKDYLIFFNTLNIGDIKVVGIVPMSEIISKVYPLLWYSTYIFLIYLLLIIIVSLFISYGIISPLRELEKLMFEIRNENFKVHMDYNGKDEISILSSNFNLMVERLNQLIYENYQSKIHESELMFLEKEAQLNALQQQINPHFLYNTLESIKWMAYKIDAIDICNMVTALGKFFRGTITRNKNLINFQQELEHLESYVYIQQIRYQDKLSISWEISDEIKTYKTIKLLLQPLLENAIIHGIEKMKKGGLIIIRIYKSDDYICLEVQDNGVGMSATDLNDLKYKINSTSTSNNDRTSIGLINVSQRIALYFGEKGSLEFFSEEGKGTIVKISIPAII